MNDPSEWVKDDPKHDFERHQRERAERGFSEYDWWNFCDYLAWVNIQGLEKFKDGVGHPADLPDMDAWRAELDIMIDGFKAYLDMESMDSNTPFDELLKIHEKGMALYAKRFASLWD